MKYCIVLYCIVLRANISFKSTPKEFVSNNRPLALVNINMVSLKRSVEIFKFRKLKRGTNYNGHCGRIYNKNCPVNGVLRGLHIKLFSNVTLYCSSVQKAAI